jgi:hypothetical protein
MTPFYCSHSEPHHPINNFHLPQPYATIFLARLTRQKTTDSSFLARPTRLDQMGRPMAPAHDHVEPTFSCGKKSGRPTLFVFLA